MAAQRRAPNASPTPLAEPSEPPDAPPDPMPALHAAGTERTEPLRAHTTIGRDPGNDIAVDRVRVSAQHAVIRWDGARWTVRDLASTNGTFVDERTIDPGVEVPLAQMTSVAFGDRDRRWWMQADGPPRPFAESLVSPGRRVEAGRAVLSLPSASAPRAMIFPRNDGWVIETAESVAPAHDRAVVMVEGQPWRLSLPRAMAGTHRDMAFHPLRRLRVRGTLHQPRIEVLHEDKVTSLGGRTDLRLLWLLTRDWAEDQARDGPDRGLTHVELVAAELGVLPNTVDVYVHRLRDRLAEIGLCDLIERRCGVGQIRLGLGVVLFEPDPP